MGKYYVGSTNNLVRRLKQHRCGNTKTTKRLRCNKLIFKQEFESLTLARKVERKIKFWKRKDYIEKIIKDGKIKYFGV